MNKGDFNFAIMVNPISGNIFVDRLIEYRLRPTLVITHDPFYTPSKSSSMDKIRFVKTYTKYLLNKEQFHHQYYTFFKSRKYKIPTFPSQIVNTARCANLLKSLNLDYIFIFTFPIIRDFIFTIPKYGTINFHPSLLPKHRGADPEFWTIKNKDKYSGMTFHYIDKGIDTGRIIAQFKIQVSQFDDSSTLSDHIFSVGVRKYMELIYKLKLGVPIKCIFKNDFEPSYEKPVRKSARYVCSDMESHDILHLVGACKKYGLALLSIQCNEFKVMDGIVLESLPLLFKDGVTIDESQNIYYKTSDGKLLYLITEG